MFCHKCGTELPGDSQFCRKCGVSQTTSVATTSSGAAVAPAPLASPKPNSQVTWRLFGIVFAIIAISWIAVAINKANKDAKIAAEQEAARLAAEKAATTPRQFTIQLQENTFTIAANGYNAYKFTVPPGAYNVHLDGDFSASGGSGNDIGVFVSGEDDFVNWENHHASKAYYTTGGQETQGKFNINLPPGAAVYELVFNNRFSLFTPKQIEAHGILTYTKVVSDS